MINHDYDSNAFNCFGKPVVQSENRGTDEKSISLTAQDFDLSATVQTRNSLLEEMNDDLIQNEAQDLIAELTQAFNEAEIGLPSRPASSIQRPVTTSSQQSGRR
mgnify:CR=1 FL=1